jgi:hypothetical protein
MSRELRQQIRDLTTPNLEGFLFHITQSGGS